MKRQASMFSSNHASPTETSKESPETAPSPVFELVDEFGNIVPLRLADAGKSAEDPAAVFSDRTYMLRVGLTAAAKIFLHPNSFLRWDPTYVDCTLLLNGAFVPTRLRFSADGTTLVCPVRDASGTPASLFADSFGYANLRLTANSSGAAFSLESEPVAVLLPEGPAAESVAAMAKYVESRFDELLSVEDIGNAGCTVLKKHEANLEERRAVYEEALRTFEKAAQGSRGNASAGGMKIKTKLSGGHGTPSAARSAVYVASHPYLLEPSATGGIRIGRRYFVPRSAGLKAFAKAEAEYEKRAVLGYLDSFAERLIAERTAAFETAGGDARPAHADGYADAGTQAGIDLSAAREHADALTEFERRAKAVKIRLSKVFSETAMRVSGLPKNTRVFSTAEPFKSLYKAMASVEALGRASFRRERAVLAFLARSRLYELYALIRVLDAFLAKGYRLESKHRFPYPEEKLYSDSIPGIECANTFSLVRQKGGNSTLPRRLTVFYEPVVRPAGKGARNGMELCRTNLYGISGGGSELRTVSKKRGFYTPDIVVVAESRIGRTWYVADAKYSTKATVLLKHGVELAFRYLLSVAPIRMQDRFAGVWLLLGKEDDNRLPPSLNQSADDGAGVPEGTLHDPKALHGRDFPLVLACSEELDRNAD